MIPDRDSPPHDAFSRGRTASLSPERTQTAAYMITTLLSSKDILFATHLSPDRSRNRYGACRNDTPRKNPDKAAHASPALSRTAPFRSFPVRLRRTGAHGNGTASASFRCRSGAGGRKSRTVFRGAADRPFSSRRNDPIPYRRFGTPAGGSRSHRGKDTARRNERCGVPAGRESS